MFERGGNTHLQDIYTNSHVLCRMDTCFHLVTLVDCNTKPHTHQSKYFHIVTALLELCMKRKYNTL